MVIEIDFQSDEALYTQLMNQIIMGIATSRLQEGDPLPSVRQLADKPVSFCRITISTGSPTIMPARSRSPGLRMSNV